MALFFIMIIAVDSALIFSQIMEMEQIGGEKA